MKRLLAVTLLSLGAIALQNARGASYDMAEINGKLERVTGKKLHLLDDANAFSRLQRDPDFALLENKCKADWGEIIDHFEAIEGGEESWKLVVSALQVLDAEDYMSAIEKLITRFEAGTVGEPVMDWILNPPGRMRAFLADNHAHARVSAALARIKVKVGGTRDLKTRIDDLSSGKSKLGIDQFRDAHQDTSEGNIPTILLAD